MLRVVRSASLAYIPLFYCDSCGFPIRVQDGVYAYSLEDEENAGFMHSREVLVLHLTCLESFEKHHKTIVWHNLAEIVNSALPDATLPTETNRGKSGSNDNAN